MPFAVAHLCETCFSLHCNKNPNIAADLMLHVIQEFKYLTLYLTLKECVFRRLQHIKLTKNLKCFTFFVYSFNLIIFYVLFETVVVLKKLKTENVSFIG